MIKTQRNEEKDSKPKSGADDANPKILGTNSLVDVIIKKDKTTFFNPISV